MVAGSFGATESRAYAASESILWGAWVNGAPWETEKLADFERRAGKGQSIIHFGQPWMRGDSYQPFLTSAMQMVRDRGAIPLLDWGSWDYSLDAKSQPRFRLATIINGEHDGYIRSWAHAAKAWGHPFFLRFNPEMNGWWLPWSEQVNNNQPGEFARAWRHVHDIFTQEGVTNATWVWCPNVVGTRSTPIQGLYPGAAYVDWTCLDGYNFGNDMDGWETFEQVFAGSANNGHNNSYQQIVDLAPDKPMMIGETGTSLDGGDAAAWVLDALTNQLPNRFPQIKALVWFNWNGGEPQMDWPIESSPALQRAFAQGISSSYYASNTFGQLGPGRIAAPGGLPAVASAAAPAPMVMAPEPMVIAVEPEPMVMALEPEPMAMDEESVIMAVEPEPVAMAEEPEVMAGEPDLVALFDGLE